MIHSILSILLTAAVPVLPTGGVVVFKGLPGQAGDVAVADPAGLQPTAYPAALQGIRLLPIEFHGRADIERLLPNRPRLRTDVPAAARIELPQGVGSLYRFSRDEAGGGTTFGLMLVDAAGEARSVWELAGIGTAGNETPFKQRVAVAPAGDVVLIATKPEAGGDLLELELSSGLVTNRTAGVPTLKFGRAGLALAGTWGVAVCADRILRFDRAGGGDAESVALGSGGLFSTKATWFSGELALSPSGTVAATTIGGGPTSAHVWAFGPAGAAVRVTKQAAHLSSAGFLPESIDGPYLAISDDGSRCAWRTEGLTREAFMAPVPALSTAPVASVHLTSDPLYLDTLDEIGQFMFQAISTTLRLAVGESGGNEGIENLDFYDVGMPSAGVANITNVTLSNGILQPPFIAPSTLKPTGTAWVPGSDGYLFVNEMSGGSGELASSFGGSPTLQTLVPDVKELSLVELVGGELVVGLRRSTGNKDYELWQLPSTLGSASFVATFPGSSDLDRPALRPDGWIGFLEETPAKERLWLYDTVSGTLRNYRRLIYGPALDFAPTGELAFSIGSPGGPAIQAVLPVAGGPSRLKVPVAPSFVLPGS